MLEKITKGLLLLLSLVLVVLPMFVKRWVYSTFFDFEINKTAKIGFSFIFNTKIKMGENTRICHFCFIKNLELLELKENSKVGNFTRATAIPINSKHHFYDEVNRFPALILDNNASIVGGGHYFDCNNTITIGEKTIIAGNGSSFFTHGIDINENRQRSEKIQIGSYSIVSARCVVLKGAKLPDFSILAANSTLHKKYEDAYYMYSGVPAIPVKELSTEAKFFFRKAGFVP